MADDQFTIGRDARLTILSDGQPIRGLKLTKFSFKQMTTRLTSKPINGRPVNREIEEGWEGDFEWDRINSALDDYFTAKEAAMYAGAPPPVVAITHRIRETDGSLNRYRYDAVALKLDDGGSYESDSKVVQKVSWISSQRFKV